MNTFFNKSYTTRTLASMALVGLLGSVSLANAQILSTTSTAAPVRTAPTPVAPVAPSSGLTVSGWQQTANIALGQNQGGDGKGTVSTLTDGIFRLGVEANLASNSNPACTVDCRFTLARASIIGEQITAVRSVNQGIGNSPVSSTAATNGMFNASMNIRWVATPAPAP